MTGQTFTLGPDDIDPETVAMMYGVGPLYREDLVPPPAGDSTWGLLRALVEDEERRRAWWRRIPEVALEAVEPLVCPQCARFRGSPAHWALLPFHDDGSPR